jgi:membrane-associated phospholipid phosphatase
MKIIEDIADKHPFLFPDNRKMVFSGILTFIICFLLFQFVDRPIALSMQSLPPDITAPFSYITRLGKPTISLVTFGVLFLLFYTASGLKRWAKHYRCLRKYAWIFLFIFISIVVSGLITDLLKIIFARYRPAMFCEAGKYGFIFFKFSPARILSFPSGHANTIFAFMTALFLIAPRYRFACFIFASLIASSRVITGAHFPSDVVAGAYLGVIIPLYLKGLFLFLGIDIFGKKREEKLGMSCTTNKIKKRVL